MEYIIVTNIPIYKMKENFYWPDVWGEDVSGQISFWDKVTLFCPHKEVTILPRNTEEIPINQINLLTYKKGTFRSFIDFIQIQKKILLQKSTIYEFAGSNINGMLGFLISILFGEKRNVITFDSPVDLIQKTETKSIPKKILKPFYCAIMKKYRIWSINKSMVTIVVGLGILNDLNLRYDDSKILSVPLSLFDESFVIGQKDFDDAWDMKKDNNTYKIMCCDRFSSEKGVFELVEAMNNISKMRHNIILELYNDGPQKEQIVNYIENNSLKNHIILKGKVSRNELIEAMRQCDLFVNFTKTLDLNRTMIEAATQGCAILGSDLYGVSTFFDNSSEAYLINPNSVNEITESILYLIDNYSIRLNLANNVISKIVNYTSTKTKKQRRDFIINRYIHIFEPESEI